MSYHFGKTIVKKTGKTGKYFYNYQIDLRSLFYLLM